MLALVLDMTVIPDTNSSPTLAERWIKANIAAAIVAGLASLAVYAVKQGASAADAQAGSGALFILYLAAVVFSGLSGAAGGVLTGAVLQRIVRRLPARTWIVLHAAMSSGAGVRGCERQRDRERDCKHDATNHDDLPARPAAGA